MMTLYRHVKDGAKCLILVYRGPNVQSHTTSHALDCMSRGHDACLANAHTFTALVVTAITYNAVERSHLQLLAHLVGTKLVSASNDDNDIEREIERDFASFG